MTEIKFIDYIVATIIFVLSISEMYKGFLLVFSNRNPILFTARIGFLALRLLPKAKREERQIK